MDIREIRRQRLKQWFADKPLPKKEMSYISQLINGKSSFGERAAARIENDYRMPVGYLSQPYDASDSSQPTVVLDEQEERLITLFREFPDSAKTRAIREFEEKAKEFNELFDELLRRSKL